MINTLTPAVTLMSLSDGAILRLNQIDYQTKRDKDFMSGAGLDGRFVRRPLMGMSPKKDTYGCLTVVSPEGDSIQSGVGLANSSVPGGKSGYTTNFLIQSISESRQEKAQPVPTFGDTFYYFFGQQPVQIQVNAVLLNSRNFEWELEWWHNYSNVLRGTKLVDGNRRVKLTYESTKVTGYISTCSVQKNANTPMEAMLNFTLFVDKKTATTSTGEAAGHTQFSLPKNFATQITEQASNPVNYTKKLDTAVLGETLSYIKDLPDIDDVAGKSAIFGNAVGGFLAKASNVLNDIASVVTNPIGSLQDLILSKKEAEITVVASSAFDLNVTKALAAASSSHPLKDTYQYSDILAEYVGRRGFTTPESARFYDEVISRLAISEAEAIAQMNSELSVMGLQIQNQTSPQDINLVPEGGLKGGYEREIERKKDIIKDNLKNQFAFQAKVGLLVARREVSRFVTQGPRVDPPSSSEIEALANSINSEV